jgi:purine-binding chemotaxis protein CheW
MLTIFGKEGSFKFNLIATCIFCGLQMLAGKYLTFTLGAEEYGLQILKVREIIGYMEITGVPRAPHDVRGVINLRGQVVPVVDMMARFGMEASK